MIKNKPTLEDYKEIISIPLEDLIEMEQKLSDKVWYTRHKNFRDNKKEWDKTPKDIRDGAIKSAEKLENEYGGWLLDYEDDFEWGMINGQLEMIRWILFGNHDDLST